MVACFGAFYLRTTIDNSRRYLIIVLGRVGFPACGKTARVVTGLRPVLYAAERLVNASFRVGHGFTGCGKTPIRAGFGKGTSSLVP